MEDYTEYKYHGFCAYTTTYYMTDVDDFNTIEIILTMKSVIDFCLEKYVLTEEEVENKRKNKIRERNRKLRNKIISGKASLEDKEEAMEIWPHSKCEHTLYYEKCGMCINGCDFY